MTVGVILLMCPKVLYRLPRGCDYVDVTEGVVYIAPCVNDCGCDYVDETEGVCPMCE